MDLLVTVAVLALAAFGAQTVWPWALDRWRGGHGPAKGDLADVAPDAPAECAMETRTEPPGQLRVRGMTRWLLLVFFWLFGLGLLAGALNGLAYVRTQQHGLQDVLGVVGLSVGGLATLGAAVRGWRRGIDADAEGVVVINTFKTHRLTWSELVDITYDRVENQGGGTAYHRLCLETERGKIVAEAPGGSTRTGSRLVRIRGDLLAMRDHAVRKSP